MSTVNAAAPNADGRYVLYWMQHSQRAFSNPALERAVAWANACGLPLLVLFVIDPDYPEANARHYAFMLEGLKETMSAVRERGAHMALRMGAPPDVAAELAREAAIVVLDRGYLRHLCEWRRALAEAAPCFVEMVEGDVVVPVEAASTKAETAARTIRSKLMDVADDFASEPDVVPLSKKARGLKSDADRAIGDIAEFLDEIGCDASVPPVEGNRGGTDAARKRLADFVSGQLPSYGDGRADIVERNVSHLSPYLHFGQISPVEVYNAVRNADAPDKAKDSFIDEMLVRRELAVNFVHYTPEYDSFSAMPEWARKTLAEHRKDEREGLYSRKALEDGKTADPLWNAAMREMRVTGYLHNHMRMYWGKRLIAYTRRAEDAYEIALALNNKYLIDGRDANSYANIGWLFGLHDRGWPERDVFGKVRSMTASGLKRKFDTDAYLDWVATL